MTFIAGKISSDEILCSCPPHILRIDLQARRWKSDTDSESAIIDANDNGIPIEFILLGFTPFFGNLGMRAHEEFIRIAFIGVTPTHRLLPPRCVTTSVISGKSSQKNFISYFQTLYNNRIDCGSVITTTKFSQRSFTERDKVTGADTGKINYNVLEFADRPVANPQEEDLVAEVAKFLQLEGGSDVSNALRSHIAGSNLVELPLGTDHQSVKDKFAEDYPKLESQKKEGLSALPSGAGDPTSNKDEPPKAKAAKNVELSEEQKKALIAAGLSTD